MKFAMPKFSLPPRKQRETKELDPRLLLIQIMAFVTGCAAITEWVWAILFCIEATGGIQWHVEWENGIGVARVWEWLAGFKANVPVLFALLLATVPIVLWSMIWLPAYQQARGAGAARRFTMAAAGILANALVILSGTIVMNGNRQEHVRADLVVEQSATAQRTAIQAQIDAVNADLARLTDKRVNNEYAATAANVGADAYRAAYMSQEALARSPVERRDIIVRALGAGIQADTLKKQRTDLIAQLAAAAPAAATQAVVQDTYGAGMNAFAQYAQVYRPPFVALICTLIGIWGAWWLVGVWERYREARGAQEPPMPVMIEDRTAEPAQAPMPMQPAEKREAYYDENGNRIVRRRATWAKVRTKKVDGTEIEQGVQMPSDQRIRAETVDENRLEAVGLGQAGADPEVRDEAPEESAARVSAAPEPAEPAADLPERGEAGDVEASVDAPAGTVEPEEAPIVLTDDRVDELIEQGIVDAETGEIRSQEHVDIIRQSDRAVRYPALADQREKEEAA